MEELQAQKDKITAEINSLNKEKESIHKDIVFYGQELDKIKLIHDEESSLEVNIESLQNDNDKLESLNNDLVNENNSLNKEKKSLEKDIEYLQNNLKNKDQIEADIKELEIKLDSINTVVTNTEKEKEFKVSDLTNIKNQIIIENKNLESLKESYTLENSKLEEDFSTKKSILELELSSIKQDLLDKKAEYKTIADNVETLKNVVSPLASQVEELKNKVSNLNSEYENKKIEKEKEISNMSSLQDQRQIEQDKREGDLSLKEKYFEEKRTNLNFIKTQIEKKTGQPINLEF